MTSKLRICFTVTLLCGALPALLAFVYAYAENQTLTRSREAVDHKVDDMQRCLQHTAHETQESPSLPTASSGAKAYSKIINSTITNVSLSRNQSSKPSRKSVDAPENFTLFVPGKTPCQPEPQDCDINKPVVPDIVHFIWIYNRKELKFMEYLSILSVLRFHRPLEIWMWCQKVPGPPQGNLWEDLVQHANTSHKTVIQIKYTNRVTHIYGKKIERASHGADFKRLEILLEYGGIYLDIDTIVLRSLRPLMCYPYTAGQELKRTLSNGILIANRSSIVLREYFDSYKSYNNKDQLTTSLYGHFKIWRRHLDVTHVERECLLRPRWSESGHKGVVYNEQLFFDWSKHYTFHVFQEQRLKFSPTYLEKKNNTLSRIMYYVYYGEVRDPKLWNQTCTSRIEKCMI